MFFPIRDGDQKEASALARMVGSMKLRSKILGDRHMAQDCRSREEAASFYKESITFLQLLAQPQFASRFTPITEKCKGCTATNSPNSVTKPWAMGASVIPRA